MLYDFRRKGYEAKIVRKGVIKEVELAGWPSLDPNNNIKMFSSGYSLKWGNIKFSTNNNHISQTSIEWEILVTRNKNSSLLSSTCFQVKCQLQGAISLTQKCLWGIQSWPCLTFHQIETKMPKNQIQILMRKRSWWGNHQSCISPCFLTLSNPSPFLPNSYYIHLQSLA